ncbi:MAG TPA: helix-turn-helix transcriptional regulator [Candidatus Scybalomonas excrementigallinarum]|nr:helix-turn-helix transcriptional regulator [Candidatus Scybalomonas excrementigallinarum]
MLNENLKTFRKQKGLSQEELAIRLNVVRQTISKWEKGLSVPDSDMLVKMADILEVSVGELLGSKITDEQNKDEITEQLIKINEYLAIKNRRIKTTVKVVIGIVIGILVLNILFIVFGMVSFNSFQTDTTIEVEENVRK